MILRQLCGGLALAWLLTGLPAAAENPEALPQQLLESQDFHGMKADYQACVLLRGSQLMAATNLNTAVELAPVACRRELLRIKRLMLASAFKVDVINGLLESIAEGVMIDLVNALLQEKLAGMLREVN